MSKFKAFQMKTTNKENIFPTMKRVTRGNEDCKTFNVTFSQFQFILSVISTDFLFPLFMELHLLNWRLPSLIVFLQAWLT